MVSVKKGKKGGGGPVGGPTPTKAVKVDQKWVSHIKGGVMRKPLFCRGGSLTKRQLMGTPRKVGTKSGKNKKKK